MVTVQINEVDYPLPLYFSVDQWVELVKWDLDEPKNWTKVLSVSTGCPLFDISDTPVDGMQLAMAFVVSGLKRRKECKHKPFSDLSFGQWVDLDVYLSLGVDKYLKEITNILVPEAKDAAEALWVLDNFINFRKYIYREYKELFGTPDEDEPLNDDGSVDKPDGMQVARNWYKIIVRLSGDDILKMDAVTEQPLKKVFNFMALQKEETLELQRQQRQQQREYDLQRNR